MPDFAFTAKDRSGNSVSGTVTAENSGQAVGKVRSMGYDPEKVRAVDKTQEFAPPQAMPQVMPQANDRTQPFSPPQIFVPPPGVESRPGAPSPRVEYSTGAEYARQTSLPQRFAENFVYPVVSGVPLKELALMYRQFSTLINAGISIHQAVGSLAHQTKNAKLREILLTAERRVQVGGRISDSFAEYPWVFNNLQIAMLRAAEQGGLLEEMLKRISDYLEREIALRQLINRLTLYPKIVSFMALMLLGGRFFTDGMPAISKVILGGMGKAEYSGMDYLKDTVGILGIAAVIVFAIVAFCKISLFQSDAAAEAYEKFKMRIPGLGKVSKSFALAKFGHAFGAMYAGGLPINTAIRVAGDASGSRLVAAATRSAIGSVERGLPLSMAFAETGLFPKMVLDMMNTGEQTGNVDAMMSKVAEYLEGDAETKAHMYSHIFATSVYLLVALFVAMAVIRFWSGVGAGISSASGD